MAAEKEKTPERTAFNARDALRFRLFDDIAGLTGLGAAFSSGQVVIEDVETGDINIKTGDSAFGDLMEEYRRSERKTFELVDEPDTADIDLSEHTG